MKTIDKEILLNWIDLAVGLSEKKKAELLKLDVDKLEYVYKMVYLNKEEEIVEISYIPPNRRKYKEAELFYKQ